MKSLWIVLAFLLFPAATATAVLTDPSNDERIDLQGQSGGAAGEPHADLLQLDITDHPHELRFFLEVAKLYPDPELPNANWHVLVGFGLGDSAYLIECLWTGQAEPGIGDPRGTLWREVGGSWEVVQNHFDVTLNEHNQTVEFRIPRPWLTEGEEPISVDTHTDQTWALLRYGYSYAGTSTDPRFVTIMDRMPDEGISDIPHIMKFGSSWSGGLEASAEENLFWSNGGETLHRFDVELRTDRARNVTLALEDVPEGWQIGVPFGSMQIAGSTQFPVFVATPFEHRHGAIETFDIVATSPDGAEARLQLGVEYPKIPQPAGHHPDLFLHALRAADDSGIIGFMNAASTDPRDLGEPVTGSNNLVTLPWDETLTADMWAPGFTLDPKLQIPMVWNDQDPALLKVPIRSEVDVSMSVESVFRFQNDDLAISDPQDITFTAGETKDLEFTLAPVQGLQQIDPHEKFTPRLGIRAKLTGVQSSLHEETRITVEPGGVLSLPLLEWEGSKEFIGGELSLEVQPDRIRPVNPGRTALFQVHIEGDDVAHVQVVGTKPWFQVAKETVDLDKDPVAQVAVQVPEGEAGQAKAVVLVMAEGKIGYTTLVVDVDDSVDIPDEAKAFEAATKGKESPMVAIPMLAGVLALFALRRRIR